MYIHGQFTGSDWLLNLGMRKPSKLHKAYIVLEKPQIVNPELGTVGAVCVAVGECEDEVMIVGAVNVDGLNQTENLALSQSTYFL